MNQLAWNIALAASSVVVGIGSLWALFRPMAAGIARKAADQLKQELRSNEFRDVNVRFERLEAGVNGRMDRLEARFDRRVDQLDVRLTAAIGEVRADLGTLHETQGRILEAIRALSPVGNQR